MLIELKVLNKEFYSEFKLPEPATKGSVAVDLYATDRYYLSAGGRLSIKTGLAIHIKSNLDYYSNVAGLIVPRSGLGTRGLVLANTVGVIDGDYQGELVISAWNSAEDIWLGDRDIVIDKGMRVAQLMFVPVLTPEWVVVDEFTDKTIRGVNGFGSTGE